MKKIVRLAALTVMAFSLTTGVAAANSGSISDTGPESYNKIEVEHRNRVRVSNDNDVNVGNLNFQFARTGDASVVHNTNAGSARSGDATNDNLTRTSVGINNSLPSGAWGGGSGGSHTASIRDTGPKSYNKVEFESSNSVKVRNENDVNVLNLNVQKASSGDAKVWGNTNGGSATSGDATNVNTTETTVNIRN